MKTIGSLTSSKLEIARELNHAKVDSTGDAKLAAMADKQERERIATFVKTQEKEIAALRNEISLLKRKDVTQTLPYLPAPPGKQSGFSLLPPIPSASGSQQASGKFGGR